MAMREQFDLDPKTTYLNSGTQSICPRSVFDAVLEYQRRYERNPTEGLFSAWPMLWETQIELAKFFVAEPEDLFLRTNVTLALNAFIMGIPLPSDGEILVSHLEYGAIVNICRLRAEQSGLSLRTFHLPAGPCEWESLTPAALAEQIVGELRPETRLLLLSHVMTGNGLVLPIREIARETRKRGILLVVDGAHAPGAVPLRLSELADVDFYAGNLHKWMMGPKGTAFGWVPERHQRALLPTQAGWTTFENPKAFERFGGGAKGRFASRFLITGCHEFASFYGIREMLRFWRMNGEEKIRKRIYELQDFLETEMSRELGWTLLSPPRGPMRGPLLSYELPSTLRLNGYELMDRLRQEHGLQIILSPVGDLWQLRLSPHIYNSEDEIRHAVSILRDFRP